MIKVKILGANETTRLLENSKKKTNKNLNVGLVNAGIHLSSKIKESIARGKNAPVAVDTGAYLRSVTVSNQEKFTTVFSPISYSKFIEFGTSRMSPRPHFKNTLAVEKIKINNIILKEIKKL